MYIVWQYITFLFRSSNQHGIHSPYVYELITKCLYSRISHDEYTVLQSFRESLYKNSDTIKVKDFGAGSRVFKSNLRKISRIARAAGITKKRAKLLFRLTTYFQPNNILELGTSLGIATAAMHLGNPKAKIVTIEGCKETARIAKQQFDRYDLENINLIRSEFNAALHMPEVSNCRFDLIYVDGNHNKEATLDYFHRLLPNVSNDSVMILDDIHWSKGMTEAWEIIKEHEQVRVSIDTFYWGLVFFRKEQEKQHFSIRM